MTNKDLAFQKSQIKWNKFLKKYHIPLNVINERNFPGFDKKNLKTDFSFVLVNNESDFTLVQKI